MNLLFLIQSFIVYNICVDNIIRFHLCKIFSIDIHYFYSIFNGFSITIFQYFYQIRYNLLNLNNLIIFSKNWIELILQLIGASSIFFKVTH